MVSLPMVGTIGNRPLVYVTLGFVMGILASAAIPWTPSRMLIVGGLVVPAAVFFVCFPHAPVKRSAALALFFAFGLVLGADGWLRSQAPPELRSVLDGKETVFHGKVCGFCDFYPGRIRIPVRLVGVLDKHGRQRALEGAVLLSVAKARTRWVYGDEMIGRFRLLPFHNFNNPGGFDYKAFQARRGFFGRGYLPNDAFLIKVEPGRSNFWSSWSPSILGSLVDGFRQKSRIYLRSHVPAGTFPLLEALLLGYRHEIPPETQRNLREAGIAHILAISGLHIGLVAWAVFWLIRWISRLFFHRLLVRIPDRHLAWIGALAAATLYAILSGLAVPTRRAILIFIMAGIAGLSYRRTDPPSFLSAAALLLLALEPRLIASVSFQLSFAATLGILCFFPRWHRIIEDRLDHPAARIIIGPLVDTVLLSTASLLFILPLLIYHFHGFSAAGILSNALVVPAIGTAVLPLGLLSLGLWTIHLPGASLSLWAASKGLHLCLKFTTSIARHPWAFHYTATVPVIFFPCYALVLLTLILAQRTRTKIVVILTTVFAMAMIPRTGKPKGTFWQPGRLTVAALDVGQGTSTFIRFPNDFRMLVDGGGFYDNGFDVGRNVVAPFLWSQGIRKLDVVVLSHDHPDHRNGLTFILEHFDVKQFWEPGPVGRDSESLRLHRVVRLRSTPTRHPRVPWKMQNIGGCALTVLHPDRVFLKSLWHGKLNRAALVLRIDYGATSVFLPSDIDAEIERRIFRPLNPHLHVLLVAPHHGSARSNSRWLAHCLHPKIVFFSCGFHNPFGFPSPAVMKRYRQIHAGLYRTDRDGTLWAFSDGRNWQVSTFLSWEKTHP